MAIHRDVVERIGDLDESYFLYFEDVDYSGSRRTSRRPDALPGRARASATVSRSRRAKLGTPAPRPVPRAQRDPVQSAQRSRVGADRAAPWIALVAARELAKVVIGRDRPRARAVLAGIRDALTRRWGMIDARVTIGIECESLEGQTFGVGRLVEKLIDALGDRESVRRRFHITLYSNGPLPDVRAVRRPAVHAASRRSPRVARIVGPLVVLAVLLRCSAARASTRSTARDVLPELHAADRRAATDRWCCSPTTSSVRPRTRPSRSGTACCTASSRWAGPQAHATRVMTLSEASAEHLGARGIDRSRIVVNPLAVDAPRPDVAPRRSTPSSGSVRRSLAATCAKRCWRSGRSPRPSRPPSASSVRTATPRRPSRRSSTRSTGRSGGRDRLGPYVADDDLAAAYASAGAIVYVSETEAFGLPPLEALSYGTPAVLADTPVNRELYGQHGVLRATPRHRSGDRVRRCAASMHDGTRRREAIRASAGSITEPVRWSRYSDRFLAAMTELSAS